LQVPPYYMFLPSTTLQVPPYYMFLPSYSIYVIDFNLFIVNYFIKSIKFFKIASNMEYVSQYHSYRIKSFSKIHAPASFCIQIHIPHLVSSIQHPIS
jgi:hypothetical protein